MSRLERSMKRAFVKASGKDWPSRTQPVKIRDTYYLTLHPTHGWKRVSDKRIIAQHRMAQLLGN